MFRLLFNLLIFFMITTPSLAYIGPGLGGGTIAALVGILIAFFAAVFGLIWFPLKRLFKNRKEKKDQKQQKVD